MDFRYRPQHRAASWYVSKAGVKTSIGKRSTTVSIRGDRVRGAVRIPRTGLSYSE